MSISGWVDHLIDEGRLCLLEPVFQSDEAKRTLLISPEIEGLIEGPWPTKAWEVRAQRLRADLENFAAGGEISVCAQPYGATVEDLGLLGPPEDGVWDWRSREPNPGLRLLGQFLDRDTLVLLVPAMRSKPCEPPEFIPRGPLGDADSAEWRAAIEETVGRFRTLFQPHVAIAGDNVQHVLSGGYNQSGDGEP